MCGRLMWLEPGEWQVGMGRLIRVRGAASHYNLVLSDVQMEINAHINARAARVCVAGCDIPVLCVCLRRMSAWSTTNFCVCCSMQQSHEHLMARFLEAVRRR